LLTLEVRTDVDVVTARQLAREVAVGLGCERRSQTRLAVATSEIVRGAFVQGRSARVAYLLAAAPAPGALVVEVTMPGDRIGPELAEGIEAARRVVDALEAPARDGAVAVRLVQHLDAPPPGSGALRALGDHLRELAPSSLLEELRAENRELLTTLDDLQRRHEDVLRLNEELEETNRGVMAMHVELSAELEETNRGVVALYADLDRANQALVDAAQQKTRLYSMVGHELRSPLNTIRALTELLLQRTDGDVTAEQERQLRFIDDAGRTLSRLVDDLLDLARAEAGSLVVVVEAVDVTAVVAAELDLTRPLAEAGVELALEVVGDGPSVVTTDAQHLQTVVRNLLANAAKYTTAGSIRAVVATDDREELAVSVVDTGIGIAPEDLGRVFDEFVQVPGPEQRRRPGSGLGLALSRRLVDLLGGELTATSAVGAGSTFTVRLPRTPPAALGAGPGEPAADREPIPAPVAPGPVAPDGAPLVDALLGTLAVVDDDPAWRYRVARLGERLGCAVVEASAGEEGVALVRATQPQLVVLDLALPDLSGERVLGELRADPSTSAIPVVICSGLLVGRDEHGFALDGAAALLAKGSVTDDELVDAIERLRLRP
jgi:signal transduction histidine kinase/CheY-like chemotaxis protein